MKKFIIAICALILLTSTICVKTSPVGCKRKHTYCSNSVVYHQKTNTIENEVFQKTIKVYSDGLAYRTRQIAKDRNTYTPKFVSLNGAGVVISSKGHILTASHLVSSNMIVIFSNGKRYKAVVVSDYPAHDIALLRINESNLPYAELSNDISEFSKVYLTGNPENKKILTTGKLDKSYKLTVNRDYKTVAYRYLAPIRPGFSGGGVFNSKGELLGIMVSMDDNKQGGYAIPIEIYRKISR
jgi:S1-C subfamily serine protease